MRTPRCRSSVAAMCMRCPAPWARPGPGRQPSNSRASGRLAMASRVSSVFLRTNSSIERMSARGISAPGSGKGLSVTDAVQRPLDAVSAGLPGPDDLRFVAQAGVAEGLAEQRGGGAVLVRQQTYPGREEDL